MKYLYLLLLSTAIVNAQKTGRKLVWEENFDGSSLNEKTWNFELGDHGWGNHERQDYTKTNHRVANGFLTITAKKDGAHYTSTRITTKGKKEFQYGYMEARLKLPVGYGVWPAFWMLGSDIDTSQWPACGEIDIMEYVGREPHMIYTTLHTTDTHGATASSKKTEFPAIEDGFHLYAVDWNAERMVFFVDGKPVYTYQPSPKTKGNWPYDQKFFFILNLAVGGDFGGPNVDDTIFPQEYVVDYVRVYQ